MTKHIFVTGGVVSSLGKGILTASLGAVLKARDLKVNVGCGIIGYPENEDIDKRQSLTMSLHPIKYYRSCYRFRRRFDQPPIT